MSAFARITRGLAVGGTSAVVAVVALTLGRAGAEEPKAELASFEAAIEIPKLAAEDKETVEKALADAAITRVDVHLDSHEAIVAYPTSVENPDEPADKACERVRKLGGKFAEASLAGIIGGFSADCGSLKGFVVHDGTRDPSLPHRSPEWVLWLGLYPAKGHVWNGGAHPALRIALDPPKGVTLQKQLESDDWTLENNVIQDKAGVPAKAKGYAIAMGVQPGVADKEFLIRAELDIVDVPGTAHVVKLVVPVNKRWYKK